MGRRAGGLALGLAVALAAGGPAPAQNPAGRHYMTNREVGIPVNPAKIAALSPQPKDLQLYWSFNRGPWKAGAKLPANGLQDIGDGKKGFLFRAEADGEYDYGVQFHYPDGTTTAAPADERDVILAMVVDTTPPEVRVRVTGSTVEWSAVDDNLDPSYAVVQHRWPNGGQWATVAGKQFRAADSHTWPVPAGKSIEVRIQAKDKAGNDSFSQIVRVPGDGAVGTSFPRAGSSDWPAARDPLTGPAANLPQARIEYVDKKDVTVDYTIQKVGRSGVKKVRLYVQPGDGGWPDKESKEYQVDLAAGKQDQSLSLPYTVPEDGVYGFYVAPESVSGQRAAPPRKGDATMLYVVVDTKEPYVKIGNVRVTPGPDRRPQVEIGWEAADPNLMVNPVSLEWSLDPKAAEWKEIKYRLENNAGKTAGRYVWDVPEDHPWQFFVRARATDKAGNTGTHVWSDKGPNGEATPVSVDLVTPAATINGVRGGARPQPPQH